MLGNQDQRLDRGLLAQGAPRRMQCPEKYSFGW